MADRRHVSDPRSVYNTVGGINGPLVILDKVRLLASHPPRALPRGLGSPTRSPC